MENQSTQQKESATISTPFRFRSKAEKTLAHHYSNRTRNTFEGLFVTDINNNYLDENEGYLLKKDSNAWHRVQELIDYKAIIVDRKFLDSTKFVDKLPSFGKCYIYCVDTELHSGLGLINGNENYPGVRILNDYGSLISYIENKFHNQLIYVMGIEPLAELRYIINQIELFSLDIELENQEKCTEFPVKELSDFLGFRYSENLVQKYSINTISEVAQKVQEAQEQEEFSDFIKFARKQVKKSEIKKAQYEKGTTTFEILKIYRSTHDGIHRPRKRIMSRLGVTENHRFIKLNDNVFIVYDSTGMSDRTTHIIDFANIEFESIDEIGIKTYERPHSISITETQINEAHVTITTEALLKLCKTNHLQIQKR